MHVSHPTDKIGVSRIPVINSEIKIKMICLAAMFDGLLVYGDLFGPVDWFTWAAGGLICGLD